MQARVAPDDEEDISKLKTGEDAIAFFSKAGKSSTTILLITFVAAVKFVYLNRLDAYDPENSVQYRPYELVVVTHSNIFNEHYTMSASGVVHFVSQQPTEYMSLSEWMKESTTFNILQRIRFFKYYLMFKCFKLWFQSTLCEICM